MRRALAFVVPALLAAACSSAGGHPALPSCSGEPKGTSISMSAQNFRFDTSCVVAPAGQSLSVTFRNDDAGQSHNVAIYTNSSAKKVLFRGDIVYGVGTGRYDVPSLPAGRYYFRCDVHPSSMVGTFLVK